MKIESLKAYQDLAVTTRQYPEQVKIVYPMLGLVGELGEILENPEDESEYGDLCWYCVILAYDLGVELELTSNIGFFVSQNMNVLINIVCKCAEIVKKILRDEDPDGTKRNKVRLLINDILACIIVIVQNKFQKNLFQIMEANIEKLLSRKERGVIKGDGSTR